jgi:phosphopantetheinyl transferase
MDHCFFRQAEGWPVLSDWYPVVPMTMCLAMMMEAALTLDPEWRVVEVTHVRAYRWLAVSPPVQVVIRAVVNERGRVQVSISDDHGQGYIEAVVRLAPAYPHPSVSAPPTLKDERPPPIEARALYRDRWMFHGPSYQGVSRLGAIGSDGIRGTLVCCSGKGGLLDNAGQLLGFWVMVNAAVDRLAMPVTLDRLALYGPEPSQGAAVECVVKIRRFGEERVKADLTLWQEGRLWAEAEGWTDQRFQSDERLWPLIQFPDRNILSEMRPEGYAFIGRIFDSAPSRDYFLRRYLTESERAEHDSLGEKAREDWLYGRIAAKDALRHLLWDQGQGPVYPAQIRIENLADGRPVVRGSPAPDLQVSISHKDGLAVSRAEQGGRPGIDIERVESRPRKLVDDFLHPSEYALLPREDRDQWITRFWSAKEALGKALGTGLNGSPKHLAVTGIDGERIRVAGTTVATRLENPPGEHQYVVAWTVGVNAS